MNCNELNEGYYENNIILSNFSIIFIWSIASKNCHPRMFLAGIREYGGRITVHSKLIHI